MPVVAIETEGNGVTHAPFGTCGQLVVVQSSDVLHMEELEDVVNA